MVALVLSVACDRQPPIERPDESELDGLPPGMTALLNPRGEPERLLGLPVEEVDGQVVIADARRPGCEVKPVVVPTQWRSRFREDIGRTAAFAAGWQEVVELRVDYGRSLRVESEVSNVQELRADLVGPCGANVITRVLVGTGWREVLYAKQLGGAGKIDVQYVRIGGEGLSGHRIEGRFEWTEAQAWAFGLGDGASTSADITIDMPATLKSGQQFVPTIQVGRSLWLIVLYRDGEGNHGVVFPSPQLAAYQVTSGGTVELPAMIARTPPGQASAFETMIVYGFGEEGDFKQFAPPAGAISPEHANAYATDLERRLADPNQIPGSRWTSTTRGYKVEN